MSKKHSDKLTDHSPIPPSLDERVLCDSGANVEYCIIHYYDKDIGPNYDGNYVTGSSEMYLMLIVHPPFHKDLTISQPDINYQQLQFNDANQRTECSFIIPNPPELVSQREQIGLCNSNTCWFATITICFHIEMVFLTQQMIY